MTTSAELRDLATESNRLGLHLAALRFLEAAITREQTALHYDKIEED